MLTSGIHLREKIFGFGCHMRSWGKAFWLQSSPEISDMHDKYGIITLKTRENIQQLWSLSLLNKNEKLFWSNWQ